ncbi:MAG: Maf family nucleotide pyrophosphatase [Flavobacteriaceae bacterium]|jgi:septum formation protein|nr:Maf family nucleotide pyrophosphatase [Flavobacteriaceae bacterium]
MIINKLKIILASQSPRRKELLESLGYTFETVKLNINEVYPAHLKANEITEYLAFQKSKHFEKVDKNTVVITADTIVWMNDKALEKPQDAEQAKEMLRQLSGNIHQVYTSVGFTTQDKFQVFTDCSEVHFLEFTEQEIDFYVKNNNPLDKSGSYGIQDWIGLAKIDKIKGSCFTIMGLPTHIVYKFLQSLNTEL